MRREIQIKIERTEAFGLSDLGEHLTVLRPAGKAQIGEEFVDVVSDGPFISSGRKIEVLAVTGNRVVVRETGSDNVAAQDETKGTETHD